MNPSPLKGKDDKFHTDEDEPIDKPPPAGKDDGSDSDEKEAMLKIMQEEDKKLSDIFWHLVAMGESRLRFLVTLVVGVAAVISLPIQNLNTGLANIVSGLLYVGVVLFGLATFRRTIERSLGIRICAEELREIRLYMTTRCPETKGYLLSPKTQLHNLFATTRFSVGRKGFRVYFDTPGIVALINSILLSTGVPLILAALSDGTPFFFISIFVLVVFVALISLWLQSNYYWKRIKDLEVTLHEDSERRERVREHIRRNKK
ncbi:MAG TPA: hypothetical protein VF952_13070 [Chloroflexia bacterium]|jgi:hypothetical protein